MGQARLQRTSGPAWSRHRDFLQLSRQPAAVLRQLLVIKLFIHLRPQGHQQAATGVQILADRGLLGFAEPVHIGQDQHARLAAVGWRQILTQEGRIQILGRYDLDPHFRRGIDGRA